MIMEPKEQPLTIEDRDNLSSDLLVDLHAAEKHMQMIELSFVHEIQATENYKRLVKEKGKTNAEVILYAKTHRILRQDDRYRVNQVMQAFAAAHRAMQKIFNAAIENGVEDGYNNMEPLMVETNRLCLVQNLLRNISDEDMVKAISTIKVLAKADCVSDRIIDRLKQTYK